MDTLKIDIVSDIVCPWCVIGFRNLKKAMEELGFHTISLEILGVYPASPFRNL